MQNKINIRQLVNQIMYLMLVFFAVFTDTRFSEQFQYFGRSVLNVFLPFIFIIHILTVRKLVIDQFTKRMLFVLLYLCAINVIANSLWLLGGNSVIVYTENIWVKSFKSFMYWGNIVIYILLMEYYSRCLGVKGLLVPYFYTAIFLFVINIIEIVQIPHALPSLHHLNSTDYYERVRLTTTESSTTIPLIVVYGGMAIFYAFVYKKSKSTRIFAVLMLAFFIFSSGSKTMLFCVPIVMAVVIIANSHRMKRTQVLLYMFGLVFGVGVFLVCGLRFANIFNESRQSSTYSGRLLNILCAVFTALRRPFGMGAIVGRPFFSSIMENLYIWAKGTALGSTVSYREIVMVITENNDTGIAAGFFNSLLEWGILGAVLLIRAFKACYQKICMYTASGGIVLKCIYWCVIFVICFTCSFYNYFMTWGFFVVGQELAERFNIYHTAQKCNRSIN